jgi:hypothetical protein
MLAELCCAEITSEILSPIYLLLEETTRAQAAVAVNLSDVVARRKFVCWQTDCKQVAKHVTQYQWTRLTCGVQYVMYAVM